jgi:hypothetical protein
MRLFALLATLLLFASPASASRGCGSTFGAGTTDAITSTYTSGFASTATYSFWMNVNGVGGGSGGRVMNKGATSATVDAITATPQVAFFPAFSVQRAEWETIAAPSTGAWHQVVITYDGSSTANTPVIYVDGASQTLGVVASPSGTRTTDSNAYVLCNSSAGNRNFDGKLADYAMWNVILNPNETLALAKGSSPLKVRRSSLQFYTPLSGVGTSTPDWGPNRATQTLTGTVKQSQPPISLFPFNAYD